MKNRLIWIILMTLLLVSAACTPAAPAPAAEAPAAPAVSTEVPTIAPTADTTPVLDLVSPTGTKTLTMSDLKQLTALSGMGGIKSSTGKITLPEKYTGVALTDLVALLNPTDDSLAVQVEAEDGYTMTLSMEQITKGEFITYDPGTGDENKVESGLTAILAYAVKDSPLPKESDGNLRLMVISEKNDQVVDGHWSVKWVRKITLKPAAAEWTIHLKGALDEEMDRATFESGAAENCHKAVYTDPDGNEWVGIPLWLMMGRVDDEVKHQGRAYNAKLAKAGYVVEVKAADGYSVELDSNRVDRNDDIIVAFTLNGEALKDKDFPLKLVGADVTKKEGVGGIAEINLYLDRKPAPAAEGAAVEPTAAPAAPVEAKPALDPKAKLNIFGLVNQALALNLDDLKTLGVIKTSVEHPKKGKMDVEGVSLTALLEKAGLADAATRILVVSADGYQSELTTKAVTACKDCLVTFETDGRLNLVMPGMESSTWAKDVISFEIK